MYHKFLLSLALLILPLLALGQGVTSYECTMDGNLRRVVILTEPGVTVPCQVQYHKDTEAPGDMQVLWSASTQADYCETKATEFIAQLQDWGWSCSAGGETAPDAAPEAVAPAEAEAAEEEVTDDVPDEVIDDTAALEPAGDS